MELLVIRAVAGRVLTGFLQPECAELALVGLSYRMI
jgi:hypothetical protein